MNLLLNNEVILRERFPIVLSRINAAIKASPIPVIRVEEDKPLCISYNNEGIRPYGKEHSKELVSHWIRSLDMKDDSCNVVPGFGSGYHIEQLLLKLEKESVVFVVEHDPLWLAAIFSCIDCSKLLKNPRFFLATGETDETFFTIFSQMELVYKKRLLGFIYSPLYSLNEDYYKKLLSLCEHQYIVYQRLQQTNVDDSAFWQEVIFENLSYLIDAPDIEVLKDSFRDIPLVLVSAGPSLDESIEFLHKVKDHALIVCVNSAYRKLANNNLFPHITLAADPREDTFKGYAGCPLDNVFLISPYFVNPKVVKAFAGQNLTWTGNHPLVKSIRKRLGKAEGSMVSEQGTISACIADIASILGCNKICLVGQDLAVTAAGQTHTLDSFYADEQRVHMDVRQCRMVQGNVIASVPSEERLYTYLKIFEQMIAFHPGIEFINTSRLGAKITGAPYLTFDAALQWMGSQSNLNIESKLKAHCKTPSDPAIIKEKIKKIMLSTYQFTKQVLDLATEILATLQSFPPKFEKQNYSQHASI
ncbi:MAG: hypothetical protein A2007_03520, partial [Verrucomicrobia bacterium GWC2_42_7]